MEAFLSSQMAIEASGTDEEKPLQREQETTDPAAGEVSEGRIPYFRVPQPVDTEPVPQRALTFSSEELQWLRDACNSVRVTPRAATRLVNVFKLLKIIWYRLGLEAGPNEEVTRSILLILALAARYPEVMRNILRALEEVFDESSPKSRKTLKNFLMTEVASERLGRVHWEDRADVLELVKKKSVFPASLRLSEFGGENVRLLHSVCFAGEVSHDGGASLDDDQSARTTERKTGRVARQPSGETRAKS